ncbi:phage tail tip lysozyme [Cupriavidus sp. SZY C1]|uniref:phage tail tip lysozyme n=1 Tax=Cupriavidus sp. SZY C1 TaxID=3055037 RepID=UPI0028B397B1|nr:phage tail tip lysozyme [Cupriavidus sp. SZY C1]MDT6962907.1 phage tail tip lysozyme [Cupriavidus sp. SZY C1]
MAQSTVIREFLVALGFKVDEKGLKKFNDGVEQATKGVKQLVTTISASALAVSVGVSALASKLENLYFVSKRTGAAANSLKAFDFAARNLGISTETAFGAVESLAKFLRNNPAGEGYLASIGVQTRNANGELRDTVDILADIGTELAKRPTWLSSQYGKILGIDENLLLAMRDGDFAKFMQQYREMSRRNGLDKAAEDAHAFMVALRGLGTTFENFAIKVEGALLRRVGPQLARFQKWFEDHSGEISERVAEIASAILAAAAALGPPLSWLADKFIELDQATDGWSTKIMLLVGAFGALGGFKIVSGIWKMVAAVRALGAANAAAAAAGGASAAGGAAGAGGAAAAGAGWLARFLPWAARIGGAAALMFHSGGLNNGEDAELARRRAAAGQPAGTGNAGVDAVSFFQRLGWSHDQAAGIVANLQRESTAGLNHRAVGDNGQAYGVAQWHPDRQANFKAWSGKDIRDSSLMEQLQFVNYELTRGAEQRAGQLLRAAQNAQQAGEIVSRYYERPGKEEADKAREAALRGRAAVDLKQETTINLYGVSDPAAAGRAVNDGQRQVNDEIVRNMQGAIS